MKITKVDEDKVEEVIRKIEERDEEGIGGYMSDVTSNLLELFVRVQRIEERLEKIEKKSS